jgi:hypothetical protein
MIPVRPGKFNASYIGFLDTGQREVASKRINFVHKRIAENRLAAKFNMFSPNQIITITGGIENGNVL